MEILHTTGVEYIHHVGSSLDLQSVIQSGLTAGVKRVRKKEEKRYSSPPWILGVNHKRMNPHDVTKPRQVPDRTRWKVNQKKVYRNNLKRCSTKHEGSAFWQTRSNAVILHDSVPALKKWWIPKLKRFCIRRTHSSPRLPPKVTLRNSWHVQHDDHHQRGTSAGQLAADEENMEPRIDFQNSR